MRRRIQILGVVLAMATAAAPAHLTATSPGVQGIIRGLATDPCQNPLAGHRVRLRNPQTGADVLATTSPAGEFIFAGVATGAYVLEILRDDGAVLGTARTVVGTEVASSSVSIVAAATGVVRCGGIRPRTILALTGAAAAGIITAVIALKDEASPSR